MGYTWHLDNDMYDTIKLGTYVVLLFSSLCQILSKMKELWPQWEWVATSNTLRADFLEAVVRCAGGLALEADREVD